MDDILTNMDDDEISSVADGIVNPQEEIHVALQGAFKEYLICTDTSVYIIKKGLMTGHTLGKGTFKIAYHNITNVEVDFHLLSGYFEVSTGGLENKRYNYWSFNKKDDPAKQPNVISLYSKTMRDQFEEAAHFILDRISATTQGGQTTTLHSNADEIRKYKELLDEGAITQEEFDAKKDQLLGL